MRELQEFLIDGQWVKAAGTRILDVENSATETTIARVAVGNACDVDKAVKAAGVAFSSFSETSVKDRLELLKQIEGALQRRVDDLVSSVTEEMGAPLSLSRDSQVPAGLNHFAIAADVLARFSFSEKQGDNIVVKEPIGVCGMITPWNWPLNQVTCKVAPAIATGCTMVLKPSEITPTSAHILAEAMQEAGVPAGVFNLVHGDGPETGAALSAHPGVDLISFTGSTRAGVAIAVSAAPTVKRVLQELGGKSPNIILDDMLLETAVKRGTFGLCYNGGQSCNAPSRMLVPRSRMEDAVRAAAETVAVLSVGDPLTDVAIGPVASQAQFEKIQGLIRKGIEEGARLVIGGPGRPDGLDRGYFVKPTVFADVTNDMTIAREEIFGPVLCIIAYDSVEDAVAIANDTQYGLSAYVNGTDLVLVQKIAAKLRAGQVMMNGGAFDQAAPFGGYKRSGNGREGGPYGFHDYLEVKALIGA